MEVVAWTLSDALGRPLNVPMNGTVDHAQWDLRALTTGAYQLTIDTPEGRLSQRVLVRH